LILNNEPLGFRAEMSHNTVARATTSLNNNQGSLTLTFTLSYKTTTKRQDFIMEHFKETPKLRPLCKLWQQAASKILHVNDM